MDFLLDLELKNINFNIITYVKGKLINFLYHF